MTEAKSYLGGHTLIVDKWPMEQRLVQQSQAHKRGAARAQRYFDDQKHHRKYLTEDAKTWLALNDGPERLRKLSTIKDKLTGADNWPRRPKR